MIHVLFDEWLFMEIGNCPGAYGKDEVSRNYKKAFKNAKIACLDVAVKHLIVEPAMLKEKDKFIAQAFSQDDLIIQESLPNNVLQLMAVNKNKVEEVYHYFKPTPIEALVPYQIAIRAFLKSRSLLNDNRAIILVDDLKSMAIVTIVRGLEVSSSRKIAMRDTEYLASEIRRTWANYSSSHKEEQGYVLVCNNREWLSAFINLGLIKQDEIAHIDCEYPVLEGLKSAKFSNNFILPKDLAQKKRKDLFLRRMMKVLVLGVFFIIVLSAYSLFIWNKQCQQAEIDSANLTKAKLSQELALAYQTRLHGYIHSLQYQQLDEIYADFIKQIPYGYQIKEFNVDMQANGKKEFSVLMVPNGYDYEDNIKLEGNWAKANTRDEIVNNQIGTRIELSLQSQNKDIVLGIEQLRNELAVILSFKKETVIKASQYYTQWIRLLNSDAGAYRLNPRIEIVDGFNTKGIQKIEGVNNVLFKLSFYELQSGDEHLRILRLIKQYQQQWPLLLFSIALKENHVELMGGMYGL